MDAAETPIVIDVPISYQQRARDRIKRWMAGTNMSQTELGERIGRNQEWMSRYLSGKNNADLETLEQIANVFDHSLITLLDLLPRDPRESILIDRYRALSAASRTTLLEFLGALLAARPPKPKP